MRVLLDTHVFLWWLDGDRRLTRRPRALGADHAVEILVSAGSAWEIATKARTGRLPGALEVAADIGGIIRSQGFGTLDINVAHAQRAGSLADEHRDPFNRILAAQALAEDIPIVSADTVFDRFGVARLW